MRIILSILLAVGAVVGIGGGLARLHHGGRHHREHMMARVAETCVEAARNLDRRDGPPGAHGYAPPGAPPPPHGVVGPQPVFVPYPVPMPMPSFGALPPGPPHGPPAMASGATPAAPTLDPAPAE